MAFIGGEFAPAVPVQQVVDGDQRHGVAQTSFQFDFDLTDHEDAAVARSVQEWRQGLAFLRDTHVLAPPPTARRLLPVAHNFSGEKTVAQATGPGHRAADGLCRLLQAQSLIQGQHHRLGLPQLFHRPRLRQCFARLPQFIDTPCRSRHVRSSRRR